MLDFYPAILAAIISTSNPITPVQTNTIITKTGQFISYETGDDGDLRKGIASNFSRDDSTNIVSDSATGLMWGDEDQVEWWKRWVETDNCEASGICRDTSGDTVIGYCNTLSLGGYNDWRVPIKDEMLTIMDYGNSDQQNSLLPAIFQERPFAYYYQYAILEDNWDDEGSEHFNHHWFADFSNGTIASNKKKTSAFRMRCVRGAQFPTAHTNDIITAPGVATDTATGIMWEDTGDFLQSTKRTTFQSAVNKCNNLVHSGYSDWRLPNIKEWLSFVDYTNAGESPVKKGVKYRPYCIGGAWTSTTVMSKPFKELNTTATAETDKAYMIQMGFAFSMGLDKTSKAFARCIRDAQ